MIDLAFHLLPQTNISDWASWATQAQWETYGHPAWVKVADADMIQWCRMYGTDYSGAAPRPVTRVFYRPCFLPGDSGEGNCADGAAWAAIVIAEIARQPLINDSGNRWPDAIGFRNEMDPTSGNAAQYRRYRATLRAAGYTGLVVYGSFGVGRPDWPEYATIPADADALELHEYFGRTVAGSPDLALRHVEAISRGLLPATLPLFIGECGADRCGDGMDGHGWRDKLTSEQMAAQLAIYRTGCAPSVVAAFVFSDGDNGDPQWQSFKTRGTAVESAIRATWPKNPPQSAQDATTAPATPKEAPMDPTLLSWVSGVLAGIHAPVAQATRAMLVAWANAEGGLPHHNPLNTTQVMPGSTDFNANNGYPVQAYPDLATGILATVTTLTNGYYGAIVADLVAGNAAPFAADVYASPWGTTRGIDVAAALAVLPPMTGGTPVAALAIPLDDQLTSDGPNRYNECGPACIRMVCDYLGIDAGESIDAIDTDETGDESLIGYTTTNQMVDWFTARGVPAVQSQPLDIAAAIAANLAKGWPCIYLGCWDRAALTGGHFEVPVADDESAITFNNPYGAFTEALSYADVNRYSLGWLVTIQETKEVPTVPDDPLTAAAKARFGTLGVQPNPDGALFKAYKRMVAAWLANGQDAVLDPTPAIKPEAVTPDGQNAYLLLDSNRVLHWRKDTGLVYQSEASERPAINKACGWS